MKSLKPHISVIALHVLFVGSLITVSLLFDPRPEFLKQGESPGQQYYLLKVAVLLLICFYFNMFVLVPKLLTHSGWVPYLLVALAISIAIFVLNFVLLDFSAFPARRGAAPPVMLIFLLITFSVSTSIRLNQDRIKQERWQREKENESLKSELSLLRSQITPHFMFNVLNTLTSLARQKSDDLEDVIIRISHLMRYMLYSNSDKRVPLDQEVDFLNSYLEIQKLRFDALQVKCTLNTADSEIWIEPMLLIPLLENAFKHGVGSVAKPEINIELNVSNEILKFKVVNRFNRDNVKGTEPSGIGLQNVRKRLTYLYADKHELSTSKKDDLFIAELNIIP